MLEKSDTSLSETLKIFNRLGANVGLLVPTETGIEKSIMDATVSLRMYLLDTDFHDYGAQQQGQDHKLKKRAFFVFADKLEETNVSLYRPATKKGDPRIWFRDLGNYARPNNLLAVLVLRDDAYVINCSNPTIIGSIGDAATPLGKLLESERKRFDPVANELVGLIREIAARGFVPTQRAGDTGVGMTLESLLGIKANSNKAPDFKGIEIKAKRDRPGRANRTTLFSQAPNWRLSPIGSAWQLLETYGYIRDGKLRLNHEINSLRPNSIGFLLKLDTAQDWLKQNHVDPETALTRHVATWEMAKLRSRLREKHPQTFWVSARTRGRGEGEEFHYVQVAHTREPKVRNFDVLIEGGVISVDYLMSQKGAKTVRDHGYLFKMHPADFDALFPPPELHLFA